MFFKTQAFILTFAFSFCFSITWNLPPQNLSQSGKDAYTPQVEIVGSNALAIWSRLENSNEQIQTRYSTDGGKTWSTTTNLSTSGQDAREPQITMNSGGFAIAVWSEDDGTDYRIKAKYSLDFGKSWSAAATLSSTGQNAEKPQVVLNETGSAIAVWERNNAIKYSTSSDHGISWSSSADLSGSASDYPMIVMNNSGQAIALWQYNDGSNDIIQARCSSDSGQTWSTTTNLSASGQDAVQHQIAINNSGTAIAIWTRSDGSNDIVQIRYSTDGGQNWSTTTNLSASGQHAFQPQIALDNSDNAIAMWIRSDGSHLRVQIRYSTDGGQNWSFVSNISPVGENCGTPTVAMDDFGNGVTMWVNATTNLIQGISTTDFGVSWEPPVDLSATSTLIENPQVAINSTGHIIGIWVIKISGDQIIQTTNGTTLDLLSASQKRVRFLLRWDLLNEIIWKSNGNASNYKIYRDAALTDPIAIILAKDVDFTQNETAFGQPKTYITINFIQDTVKFIEHRVEKDKSFTYYLTWIDNQGLESEPFEIILP